MNYPTVTQIIDFFYGNWKKNVNPVALEKARQEGVKTHEEIRKALTGETPQVLDNSALMWLEKYKSQLGKPLYIEKRFFSDALGLSGQPDVVTENALIDWKRTLNKNNVRLQLAGYSLLLKANNIEVDAWIAFDTTKGRAYNLTDRKAEGEFLKLLRKYKEEAYDY